MILFWRTVGGKHIEQLGAAVVWRPGLGGGSVPPAISTGKGPDIQVGLPAQAPGQTSVGF